MFLRNVGGICRYGPFWVGVFSRIFLGLCVGWGGRFLLGPVLVILGRFEVICLSLKVFYGFYRVALL